MGFVLIAGRFPTNTTPHEKCSIGGSTFYFTQLPEGDFAIHESDGLPHGYGGDDVDFLMADGSIETLFGPWDRTGAYSNGAADKIAAALNRPEIAMTVTRLVVGEDLGLWTKPERVVFEEPEMILGDWTKRLRDEWRGQHVKVVRRGGTSIMRVSDVLDRKYS